MGRAIVAALAEQGAAVAIADVDTDLAADVAGSLGDHEALVVELDVTSCASVEEAFGRVASAWGPLDILVNNAGVGAAPGPLGSGEREIDWDYTWEVNVKGVVRCCAAVIAPMRERRYGRIVNLASIAGHAARGTTGPYAVTKAALLRHTKGLAATLAPFEITVNAVCPGAVWTPMQEKYFREEGGDAYENFVRYYEPVIPLGRPQDAEEIGRAVAYLASDDARSITGQCLHIDGGAVVRD